MWFIYNYIMYHMLSAEYSRLFLLSLMYNCLCLTIMNKILKSDYVAINECDVYAPKKIFS